MVTKVVHLRYPYDIYIGRETRDGRSGEWGNPFLIGRDGTREEVVAKFEDWFLNSPSARAEWMRSNVRFLRGAVLGCYCAPLLCHGNVLARYADNGLFA